MNTYEICLLVISCFMAGAMAGVFAMCLFAVSKRGNRYAVPRCDAMGCGARTPEVMP